MEGLEDQQQTSSDSMLRLGLCSISLKSGLGSFEASYFASKRGIVAKH